MAETDTLDKPKPDDAPPPAEAPKPAAAKPPAPPGPLGYGDLSAMAGDILRQGQDTEKRVAARGARIGDLVTDIRSVADQTRSREPPQAPEIPPPPQLEQRDPGQMFGTTAVQLAGLLSAFTRAPLTSALNAAGGAMKAMKEQDWATYEHALQSWKLNSDYAFKLADFQNSRYRALLENDRLTVDELNGALTAELAGNRDDIGMQKLRTEGLSAFEKLVYDRLHLAQDVAKHKETIEVQRAQVEASLSPEKRIMLQYERENPNATAEQRADFLRSKVTPLYGGRGGAQQLQGKVFTDWMAAETESRGEAPSVDEQIEKLRQINSTTASVQAAGVRAAATDRATALRRELGERALDQKDDVIAQTQWYQDQRLALMKRGYDQKDADLILREQIAEMRNDTTLRGQDMTDRRSRSIDQGIVNELKAYPGMQPTDLGKMMPDSQRKVMMAFQSVRQVEDIAKYATENPEAVGLVADALKRINFDGIQSLAGSEAWFTEVANRTDKAMDAVARERKLDQSQASKAKVLNKMVTTQAFADAAATGARPTVYLDRVFREIYQQASNLPTFLEILHRRGEESNQTLQRYELGLEKRADSTAAFPFFNRGVEAFAKRAEMTDFIRAKGLPPNTPRFDSREAAAEWIRTNKPPSGTMIVVPGATGAPELVPVK